jgi:hypothetical protein
MNIIREIFAGKAAAATNPSPSRVGKLYCPGSGTEGMAFDDAWCANCARDAAWREDERNDCCDILSRTFALDITDPDYPKEWVYGHDGRPCCTAFTTDPEKSIRCDKTPDMFGG